MLLFHNNHCKFKKFTLFIINNKIIIKMNFLFLFSIYICFIIFFYLNLSLAKKNKMNIYNNIYLHYIIMFII